MLLERFAARGLERIDDRDLDALERLLDSPDQDILEWLASASASAAPPSGMTGIVSLIRSLALGRP